MARPDSLTLLVRVLEKSGVDFGVRPTSCRLHLTLPSTSTTPRRHDPVDLASAAPDETTLTRQRLSPLLDLLADHPLSIELVGPHLKQLTPEQIATDFGRLLAEFKVGAGQERNDSLLASLAFSTRRLSDAAQKALPWLGYFRVGVFETVLLDVGEISAYEWEPVRAELEATALIRVESDVTMANRPYLRFHPTLAYAAAARGGAPGVQASESEESQSSASAATVRQRFISVYLELRQVLDKALNGSEPRWAMEVLAREEANYRAAVRWAVADQAYEVAARLADSVRLFLAMSGRLRERDTWVAWIADEVGRAGFTEGAVVCERELAWSLFTQGHPQEAIQKLQQLVERLRQPTEFDTAFQLPDSVRTLGRLLSECGRAAKAIPVLEEAVQLCVAQVVKVMGREATSLLLRGTLDPTVSAGGDETVSRAEEAKTGQRRAGVDDLKQALREGTAQLGSLAAVLGDLANAFSRVGRLDDALEAGKKALVIAEQCGHHREVAAGQGLCAQILMAQGHHAEANGRYDAALAAARRAGDKGLEASVLQHQGGLAHLQGQLDRASSLFRCALKLAQDMNDEGSQMRTCNLLGAVEQGLGRAAEARAWYERSREIALRRDDAEALGMTAQNLGILCQDEGEAASRCGDERTARQRFEEARRLVRESLRAWEAANNEPQAAMSHGQLAQVHLLLGEMAEAERHAHQAQEINERLELLPDLWKNLGLLARITRVCGNAAQAAEWERKRDVVLEELERRAQGPGGLPPQFVQTIQQLALACAHAGFGQVQPQDLAPAAESGLAQLAKLPVPWPDLAAFLRLFATRELPPIPASLPPDLQQFLHQLLEAAREAQR